MRRLIPKSNYARNVLTLISGTTLAQAIPIAISPILTRIFTPEEFGRFAVYMAVVMIVSVIVTGRYELAILLPRQEKDALHITAIAMALSVAISVILLVIVLIFAQPISVSLGDAALAPWLYWMPVSTILIGLYQSLNYWSNRKAQYKLMAVSRTVQSGSAALAQLGAGIVGSGAIGLVSGQITGQVLATGVLARVIWREDRVLFNALSPIRCLALAKKFIGFPKFMVIGQLANVASGYMPIFLLSIFYGPAIAGFYALSQRVIMLPIGVIGGAIGDVFRSEAATIYKSKGDCYEIFLKTMIHLGIISFVVVLPILLFGTELFELVFGENWREAGDLASILGIMIFFQGISSPMSQTILLAGMQKFDLSWQLLRLVLSALSLFIGYRYYNDYRVSLILFSISFSFLYVVHSLVQLFVAKGLAK
jgi:O-antigen/teichoic acid export membrane protein